MMPLHFICLVNVSLKLKLIVFTGMFVSFLLTEISSYLTVIWNISILLPLSFSLSFFSHLFLYLSSPISHSFIVCLSFLSSFIFSPSLFSFLLSSHHGSFPLSCLSLFLTLSLFIFLTLTIWRKICNILCWKTNKDF